MSRAQFESRDSAESETFDSRSPTWHLALGSSSALPLDFKSGRSARVELGNRPERSAEPRKELRLPRNRGQDHLRLTRDCGGRIVLRRNRVAIGNSRCRLKTNCCIPLESTGAIQRAIFVTLLAQTFPSCTWSGRFHVPSQQTTIRFTLDAPAHSTANPVRCIMFVQAERGHAEVGNTYRCTGGIVL